MPLTALQVKNAKAGRHADGRGLYLVVKPSGARSWVLRVQSNGRRRDFGLGPTDLVPLSEARERAIDGRRLIRAGLDPAIEWKRRREGVPTFEAAAREYVQGAKDSWRSAKHQTQWLATLERFAFPTMGKQAVDRVESPDILTVLQPLWLTKPETARRVRQRIGTVLNYAHGKRWREHAFAMAVVNKALPRQPRRDGHFQAMPYDQVPALVEKLRGEEISVGRLALEFVILTAGRSGEIRGAVWNEINLDTMTWCIPADRMKAGRDHVVPLSDAAVAVLKKAEDLAAGPKSVIFPGLKGQPLSDATLGKTLRVAGGGAATTHGMRSAFADWCAERTSYPSDVTEAALAHVIPDRVKAAYQRTRFDEMRGKLMADWADYVGGESKVIRLAVSQ